jgi:hypothetical protein
VAEDGGSRRSQIVSLSIVGMVGAVILADHAIPQGTEMRRNLYGDRAACERDYPPPPNRCDQHDSSGGGSSGGHFFYHGPYYAADQSTAPAGDPGSGRTATARTSVETSTRGGFGAFGRAAHAAA